MGKEQQSKKQIKKKNNKTFLTATVIFYVIWYIGERKQAATWFHRRTADIFILSHFILYYYFDILSMKQLIDYSRGDSFLKEMKMPSQKSLTQHCFYSNFGILQNQIWYILEKQTKYPFAANYSVRAKSLCAEITFLHKNMFLK